MAPCRNSARRHWLKQSQRQKTNEAGRESSMTFTTYDSSYRQWLTTLCSKVYVSSISLSILCIDLMKFISFACLSWLTLSYFLFFLPIISCTTCCSLVICSWLLWVLQHWWLRMYSIKRTLQCHLILQRNRNTHAKYRVMVLSDTPIQYQYNCI